MKLLANENVPTASVALLRREGHDVVHVAEDFPSVADEAVLKAAASEQRLLVTFDRDYGELIFRKQTAMPAGVVYLRLVPASPGEPGEILSALIRTGPPLLAKFTVVSRDAVRQRPLPSASAVP